MPPIQHRTRVRPERSAARGQVALLRSLPEASIDLVVADPAYNSGNRQLSFGPGRYDERGDGDRWCNDPAKQHNRFLMPVIG